MKRDKNLIAEIMQFIEKDQTSCEYYLSDGIDIKGYSNDQIIYHLDLLNDEGFIEVEDISRMNISWRGVKRITHLGHDFLDGVRK